GQRLWIPARTGAVPAAGSSAATPTKTSTAAPTPANVSPTKTAAAATARPTTSPTLTAGIPYTSAFGFDYGFQIDENGRSVTDSVKAVQAAGFNWVKVQVPWYSLEPDRKGGFKWDQLDTLIDHASSAGLKVLLSVSSAPDWARSADTDYSVNGPPANPQDMADMLAAVAERYKGRLQAIEVWSSQNLAFEWGYEELDPGRYVALLCAAYHAIKAVDPNIAVISGGLTPTGITAEGISADDLVYLRRMYAGGCQACMDGLGVHPSGYNNPPDASDTYMDPAEPTFKVHRSFFFKETILAYHDLMVSYGDTKTLVWPTMFGWASSDKPNPGYEYALDVTEAEQAAYLVKAYQMMKAWGWVGPAFTWNLDYNISNPSSDYAQFSVLNRPAYDSLKNMAK
ncbi:MAG: beta-galactosidase, partial [Anaerolineae bacterium]